MPRHGAPRGVRTVRWAVDLSPAEAALVESVRALDQLGRADFLLIAAGRVVQRARAAHAPAAVLGPVEAALARLDAERAGIADLREEQGRDEHTAGRHGPRFRVPKN